MFVCREFLEVLDQDRQREACRFRSPFSPENMSVYNFLRQKDIKNIHCFLADSLLASSLLFFIPGWTPPF